MRIKSVRRITLTEPVPVYDISVPETENFVLDAGPVVHNSKDVADAVCGVAAFLLTRRQTWTTQPLFKGMQGLMLHGSRTGTGSIELEEAEDIDMTNAGAKHGRPTVHRRSLNRLKQRKRKAN